jgi:hypothetical protein
MKHLSLALTIAAWLAVMLPARADDSLPRLERKDGRHALFVSSPARASSIFRGWTRSSAGTQARQAPGLALVRDMEKHWSGLRPAWVETDTARFRRMRKRDGTQHYVLSPHHRATLEADKRAFVAMLRHVRAIDRDHRVILVQPQNEVGSYGQPRDFSPEAEALFNAGVPEPLARAAGKSGTWSAVYGPRADAAFTAWHMARYIDEIAASGKAVLNLPDFVAPDIYNRDAKPMRSTSGTTRVPTTP